MKPETTFRRNKVDPFLKKLTNCVSFSIQQVAIHGTPDKLLCIRGRFVALELKSEDGELDPLQEYNLNQVKRCGGVAIEASPKNWPEVQKILLALDRGEDR